MTQYDRPRAWEQHGYLKTVHTCTCGDFFNQISGTNMLACLNCGETRWLV